MSIIPTIKRPQIAPNVTQQISFSGSLFVAKDQVLYGVGNFSRMFWSDHATVEVVHVEGTIWSAPTDDVANGIAGFYMRDIYVSGTIAAEGSAAYSEFGQGNAYAITVAGGNGESLSNAGTIYAVTDVGLAHALTHWSPDVVITNSGVIAARTGSVVVDHGSIMQALAIAAYNGAYLYNSPTGQILAEGINATAIIYGRGHINVSPEQAEIVNDGVIKAVSLDPGFESVGILAAHLEVEAMRIVNNGLIEADVAIRGSSATFPTTAAHEWIFNSSTGIIRGNIETAAGDDTIVNEGTVIGAVHLGEGNDVFDNRGGVQSGGIYGGAGDDTYFVDSAMPVTELADEGSDTIVASTSFQLANHFENLTLGGTGNLDATGNAFANTLKGNSGANRISGMGGDDTITGGGGSDELIGGAGADVFAYAAASDSTAAQEDWLSDFVSGTDKIDLRSILATGVSYQALDGATRITVTTQSGVTMVIRAAGAVSAADILFGTTPVPTPTPTPLPTPTHTGGPGNDTVTGTSGNDVIDGGAGGDWMDGGLGDDIYIADSQSDVARESSAAGGTDTVYSSVKFSLSKNVENLTLIGDAPVTASGNDLANILTGNSANNLIKGGLGNDTMYGGLGDDALVGGPGVDTMFGGVGDDSYYLDEGGDIINELAGEGTDTIVASTSFSLGAHVENLILTGTANLNGSGNSLDNVITGNAGANTLKGGSGTDTLNGGDGGDILNGGLGADTMDGGLGDDLYYIDDAGDVIYDDGGSDTVYSSVSLSLSKTIEHLTLTGGGNINGSGNDLNNFLAGNAGDNTLKGGNGKDTLFGGLGADVLLGGAGQDKFFFDSAIGGSNIDQLLDFSAADDTIYLDRSIFGGLATGLLANDAFRLGTSAVDADDRILYDSATGSIWYDADGNGAGAAVHFASVTPGVVLSNQDFFIVA